VGSCGSPRGGGMAGGGLETTLNGSQLTEEEVAKELVPQ
jgi:hypothetical protein